MKKILLLGLSVSLFTAPLWTAVPQQSILCEIPAYDCVPIDAGKMVKANVLISPLYQADLYHLLRNTLLTKESILSIVNSRYNTSGQVLTSVKDLHIGEILKIQKNILIKKNHGLVGEYPLMVGGYPITFGDNAIQDYGAFSFSGIVVTCMLAQANPKILSFSHCAMVGLIPTATLGALYKIYKTYRDVRENESLINKIDEMIEQIEKIEAEEMKNA